MTKEIKKIEQSIELLNIEKEKLREQIKPIPQGRFIKSYKGYSLITGQDTFVKELTLNKKPISQEKLNELRKQAIGHNEPILKRLNEIDNILPRLEEKLNNAKANELINSDINPKSKETKKTKLRYGLLEKILMTTMDSDPFIELGIKKGIKLKQYQLTEVYNLACRLFPEVDIKYNSFISKFKQKGFSKGQYHPRTSNKR